MNIQWHFPLELAVMVIVPSETPQSVGLVKVAFEIDGATLSVNVTSG